MVRTREGRCQGRGGPVLVVILTTPPRIVLFVLRYRHLKQPWTGYRGVVSSAKAHSWATEGYRSRHTKTLPFLKESRDLARAGPVPPTFTVYQLYETLVGIWLSSTLAASLWGSKERGVPLIATSHREKESLQGHSTSG